MTTKVEVFLQEEREKLKVPNPGMPDMPAKEREVQVDDEILHWAIGYLRQGRVTKITKKYIWIVYTSPSTGQIHNTKRNREIALMYSKFY